MEDTEKQLFNRVNKSLSIVHNPMMGWLVLGLSICLTIAAYWFSNHQLDLRANERLASHANEVSASIVERLAIYENALFAGVAVFNSSDKVDRKEWQVFTESLQLSKRLPGIQALGFAVQFPESELEQHIASLQAEGFTQYRVTPEYRRSVYTAIKFIEPFDWRNQRAFGYDMWTNPTRREAMETARDMGTSATSGKITLVQETSKDVQSGFLMYLPVYSIRSIPASLESKREYFVGWVYAAFRMNDLMSNINRNGREAVHFVIYDDQVKPENLLYSSGESFRQANGEWLKQTREVTMQGRNWKILFEASREELLAGNEARQPLYVLAAAMLIDILLFYVIISLHFINRYSARKRSELETIFRENEKSLAAQTKIIESTERESETFFELAPNAFIIVNNEGIVVRANQRANRMFGFVTGSMVGCIIEDLVPECMREKHRALRENFQRTNMSRMMNTGSFFAAQKRDGTEITVAINLVPIELSSGKHWVAAIHDVSAQKQIEQTLEDAKQKAEDASRSKSDFVANMSHEIRTPLNAVLGAAQLLVRTPLTQVQQKYLGMIRTSGETLLGIINDILDFSKIEAGKMELEQETFSLLDTINRVANIMSVNVNDKNIDLSIDVDPSVPEYLVGDGLRLQQVLINLVTNAIKFTSEGWVNVSISLDSKSSNAHNSSRRDSLYLKFSVSDSGIGMSQEQQKALFTAFTQADTSITRKFGGTGLGLVICSKIVQMFNGEFSVDSEIGKGSCFSFTANLMRADVVQHEPLASDEAYRIAVIESDSRSSASAKKILQRLSCEASLFNSWSEFGQSNALADFNVLMFSRREHEDYLEQLAELYRKGMSKRCVLIFVVESQQQALTYAGDLNKVCSTGLVKPVTELNLRQALLDAKDTGSTPALSHSIVEEAPGKYAGVNALIVEDNLLNQTIASGMLEDMGISFVIANNGAEALEVLKEGTHRFDIIFMDIQMPVMDGVTATHAIRSNLNIDTPIIALTAGVLHSEQQQYLDAGMNDVVPKPIEYHALVKAVGKQLRRTSFETKGSNVAEPATTTHEVFNSERIIRLARGKTERIEKLSRSLESIFDSGKVEIALGRRYLDEGDIDSARKVFHGLKGVVANYGAEKLRYAIVDLEEAMNSQDKARILVLVNVVELDFAGFCDAARQWIASCQKAS